MAAVRIVFALILMAAPAWAAPEDDALAHLDRGISAYRLGDYPTARRELDAAIELVPDRANPYRWRALIELAQHDCPNAVVDVESFLSRAPAGDDRVAELTAQRDRCVGVQPERTVGPPPPEPHVYKHWWFWTAVGAVVVTAVGVTYAATREREATLPIVHCDATGCRP
jgi:tetratricopeptide (TPR) repeat protein